MKEAAEYQVHWACGGKRATEAYLDSAEVREAIHVTPTALRKWGMETDRECHNVPESRRCLCFASALLTALPFFVLGVDFIVAVLLAVNYTCSVRTQPLSD